MLLPNFEETVKEVSEQVLYAGLRASTPPTEKQVLAAERVAAIVESKRQYKF
jgi:hypothetical protein